MRAKCTFCAENRVQWAPPETRLAQTLSGGYCRRRPKVSFDPRGARGRMGLDRMWPLPLARTAALEGVSHAYTDGRNELSDRRRVPRWGSHHHQARGRG